MIRNIKNILIILLLILGGYFVYTTWINPEPEVDLNEYIKIGSKEYIKLSSKVETIIVRDTVKIKEYVPVPGPDVPVPVPQDVDTNAILKDYYVKRPYRDIVKQYPDSTGGNSVTINDTISQNRIISREVDFNVETKTIKETITVLEPPKTKVFIGPGVDIGPTVGINGGLLIKNKQDKVFRINAGIQNVPGTNDLKPYIGGGLYWKIKFKKPKLFGGKK